MRPEVTGALVILASLLQPLSGSAQTGEKSQVRRHFADRNYQKVVQLLKEDPASSPDEAYLLGRAYQELYQHGEAAWAFSQADTSNWRVLAAWGQSLRHLGRTEEAIHRYEKAYSQDSLQRMVTVPLGQLYAEEGQWMKVRDVFAGLVNASPTNPFFLRRLGRSYQALDSLHTAATYYQQAYRQNGESTTLPIELTSILMQMGSLSAAHQVMDSALVRHPNRTGFWKRLGQIDLKAKKRKEAVQSFQRALILGDSSASTLRPLGMSLYFIGRDSASVGYLRRAFKVDTTHAQTALFLGLALRDAGRPREGVRFLEKATKLLGQADLANSYEHLGETYKALGDYPAAIQSDRMALRLAPEDQAVLFHLATLYDDYYRDPRPALNHYRLLLGQLEEIDFEETSKLDRWRMQKMSEYAHWRVQKLKKKQFFQRSSSRGVPPDSGRPVR